MSNPNWSTIATTTMENRTRKVADNVTNNNALLWKLKQAGRVKTASGGTKIVQELEYQGNTSSGWYSGYDPLTVAPTDILTAAEFSIKECYVSVIISGLEKAQNMGKEKMIDLLDTRISNAEKTITNLLATAAYSDGTAFSGKQVQGLQFLVSNAPATGTVGGINRASNAYWRNQSKSAVTDFGSAKTSANIQSMLHRVMNGLTRGTDRPDLLICDNNDYALLQDALADRQVVTSNGKMGELGFTNIKFAGADVVLDGGIGGMMPADTTYFLNTDYLFWRPMAGHDIYQIGEDFHPRNEDSMSKLYGWKGAMTMSGAQFQGVLRP